MMDNHVTIQNLAEGHESDEVDCKHVDNQAGESEAGTSAIHEAEKREVIPESDTENLASCSEQPLQRVSTITDIKPLERVYYTLPRKTRPIMRMFSRKRPKTMAEVGVQVDGSAGTSEQQLTTFLHTVSEQITSMHELCAKQDRLEQLSGKISDLLDLNRSINNSVECSTKHSDNLMATYLETKSELDNLKAKLEESFTDNDALTKRLEAQGKELKLMIRERDEFREELETSVSRVCELELSTSFARENEDAVMSMEDKLKDAVKKRDKYKKLFVKLKVNSSLVLDQYIQQLNAAIGHNRQILERSIKGVGPKNVLDQLKFIDNVYNIQEERNRLVDQVDLLDTQLVANDVLVDELREHMDNLTLLLEEYKKAKPETPSKLAQQLQAQVDKYAETMKNKEQYFAEKKASLKEQMVKTRAAQLLDAPIVVKRTASDETDGSGAAREAESRESHEAQGEADVQGGNPFVLHSVVRAVHSHGDAADVKGIGNPMSGKQKNCAAGMRQSGTNDLVVPENKVEATQSTPEFAHRGSFGDSAIATAGDEKKVNFPGVLDRHFYNFF